MCDIRQQQLQHDKKHKPVAQPCLALVPAVLARIAESQGNVFGYRLLSTHVLREPASEEQSSTELR